LFTFHFGTYLGLYSKETRPSFCFIEKTEYSPATKADSSTAAERLAPVQNGGKVSASHVNPK